MPIPGLNLTDEQLFAATNAVLPCWILLILIPRHKLTQAMVLLATLLQCALYTALLVPLLRQGFDVKEFATLAGVTRLLSNPVAVLPCWVHYAAGDLWVGRWLALDAANRRMPRLMVAPILVATCLFMPAGLGAYFLWRTAWKPARNGAKLE